MKSFISVIVALFFIQVSSSSEMILKESTDLFVRFDSKVTKKQRAKILKAEGLREAWSAELIPGLIRAIPTIEIKNKFALSRVESRLATTPGILYAEPNYRYYRRLDPAPSNWNASTEVTSDLTQWALSSSNGVNPTEAWKITTGSPSTIVAVLDTGIESTHRELDDRALQGYDFIDHDATPVDTHGHGTHVSGIIGAKWGNGGISGINEHVSILPVRVVPDDGDETDADLVEAFEYAALQGARVANCSFGKDQSGQAVADMIEAAGQKGLLVVVAAGNDGSDNNQHAHYPSNFRTSNMIVVASSNQSGSRSSFSNYGLGIVDLAAPGSDIISSILNNTYDSWSGTSMATPQVVGVAALTLSAKPLMTMMQLKEILLTTVAKRGSWNGVVSRGGLIDASAAVKAASELP